MKKHMLYLRYVLLHKWYVFVECCKLGIPLRGIIHDWSKFLPSEWRPYAQYFYGRDRVYGDPGIHGPMEAQIKRRRKEVESAFDLAWNYHQKRNKHHWQYWVSPQDDGGEVNLPMPHRYRREMLADWRGAGRAIHGKDETRQWYIKKSRNMKLEEKTRQWIKIQLNIDSNETLKKS